MRRERNICELAVDGIRKVLFRAGAALVVAGAVLLTGCSMIDEDRSDCVEQEGKVDYELELVTNISTEITTKLETETTLTTQADIELAAELRDYLGGIFTDFAHDVDLSFYDTQGDSLRLQHDRHIMDANQASYSLNLPKREYMHLAVANIVDNELVSLERDERCHTSSLSQTDRDTIDSHTTGLFTARAPMNVLEGVDQTFQVRLYMANCATALVIDTRGLDTRGMRVFSSGFASGFSICDSAYQFAAVPPMVRTTRLEAGQGSRVAFCSVNFPSRKTGQTRAVIETEEPFIAKPGENSVWEFEVYAPYNEVNKTRTEEHITRTLVRVTEPLNAGQFKIVKVWLNEDRSLSTDASEVTTSVTLDWKPGLVIEQ